MKIIILGAQGRLGQELTYALQDVHEVIPLSRFNLDIANMLQVQERLTPFKADCIINCAAITDVPHHPKGEELVFQINTVGAANIAHFSEQNKIKLIHLSCASVIAGSKDKSVKAQRKAQEIIGQSKLEAEEMIEKIYAQSAKNYRIIRAGLLFGNYGFSLVSSIQRLISQSPTITAVNDVFYSFSSTELVSQHIQSMLQEPFEGEISHCCYAEKMSVTELAHFFAKKTGKKVEIKEVSAKQVEEMPGDFSLLPSENFGNMQA